ncbi:MAG: hypothetical protein OEZ01_17810 [Candidatus Heimdallarchaeota archaeon]|nr:hypothetical protein [Candidatus Heimdallarchaeota archaeon]
MIALFLGAGFSKWASRLPIASQLFDFKIFSTSKSDQRKLNLIQNDFKKWRADHPKSNIEEFISWCICKSSYRKSRVIWYISRRLSEPFMTKIQGSFSPLMFDEQAAKIHAGVIKAKKFLDIFKDRKLSGILSCNYDTLVECALGTTGFNYGKINEKLYGRGHNPSFPWQFSHCAATGNIMLAKLHGSLSWDNEKKHTSGKPGRSGNALIIAPTPEKKPPKELIDVWKTGERILKKTFYMVIFGFAFNPYDKALLDYLKKFGKKTTELLIIDPYPNNTAAEHIWPNANIVSINPVSGVYPGLKSWLDSLPQ